MRAENAWNKLIAFKIGKDSVHKVRLPKTVLYDWTLEPIEKHAPLGQKKHAEDIESFRGLILMRNFMFHKINILSTKVLSHFYAVCFGKAASVNIVTSTGLTYALRQVWLSFTDR